MMRKTAALTVLTLGLGLILSFSAVAEVKAGDILSYSVSDDKITAYVANPEGKKAFELDCQIGTKRPESIESHLISEETVPVRTLLLIDNSLSVRSEYRDRIREILETLVDNHMAGEQYTVACFSDEITFLLTDSSDYDAVKQQIEDIEFKDQETYLTDVLYSYLTGQNTEEPGFRRIIIVSDGVDNKSIGYTKEELNEVLEKNPVPIYTLGCTGKDNSEQLKAMFALSRNSKGEGFLMDDLEDITDFIRSVKQSDTAICATIIPTAEDLDGTEKGIQVTLSTNEGTTQSSFTVNMPFAELTPGEKAAAENVPETEAIAETEPSSETEMPSETAEVVAAVPAETDGETENSGGSKKGLLLVLGGILVILVALLIMVQKKKPGSKKKASVYDDSPTELITDDDSPTELITDDDEATCIVDPMLMLINERNPSDVYSAELSRKITVGRKTECDIVIPEKTVSRQHFEAWLQGNSVMIQNLSEHGTIVNGRLLDGVQEIRTGDKILLGNIVFTVEIR